MSSRPAKPAPSPAPTVEGREDLALIRRRMRDVAEGRDEVVPWEEAERRLDDLDAAEGAGEPAAAPRKAASYRRR